MSNYEQKAGDIIIFKNKDKEGDQPDYTGKGLGLDGHEIQISLWVKDGAKGKFMAGRIQPKFVKAVYDLFDFSPPLDSKFRKLRSGANTITWERENIKNKGFDLNNPAYLASAQIVSGLTNLPLDRA